MVDLTQIQHMPVTERIHLIELILQSLKQDIRHNLVRDKPVSAARPFKVRVFNLGQEIHVDREAIYAERGML